MPPMRLPLVAACMLALCTGPASAMKIDLAKMKCEEFLKSSKDDIGVILVWLHAYYRDEDDPPVIDTDQFVADSKKLADHCVANPTIGLIEAADKVFKK